MCGIAGFCDFTFSTSIEDLKKMTDALAHRGPDDCGHNLFYTDKANIGLGHRRLSILDLSSSGHQPMRHDHLIIIFNGEIYNFKSIQKELLNKGYSFQSECDTEVLLKGFHCWGTNIVDRCIGMFAFVIYDLKENKLYLVRDRVGVKPLYYYLGIDLFLFSSELKSFHAFCRFDPTIDGNSLALYLQYGYIPAPYTIFRNTFKLLPGHILVFDVNSHDFDNICYWNIESHYQRPLYVGDDEEIIQRTEELMLSAYQYRMVSDAPLGIFLSGGYDSASVAALLQYNSTNKLKTFTIGFHEQRFNEAKEAKSIATYLGTDHHEWYVTSSDAEDVLEHISDIYDEPFADNSIVPTILVSQFASNHVKVVLSADGGDEVFGGYHKFNQALHYTKDFPRWLQYSLYSVMKFLNPDLIPILNRQYNFSTRYKKMLEIWRVGDPIHALKCISQYITKDEIASVLRNTPEHYRTFFDANGTYFNDQLNALLDIELKTFLSDNNLVKVDRATMSVSIEGREPMLDHRLIEWLAQLPGNWKIRQGVNKYLLKKIVHKYIPQNLMDRPKRPFIAPLTVWFRDQLSDKLINYLNRDELRTSGLFREDTIIKMRDDYLSGKKVNYQKIWHILVFQLWYYRWMHRKN